VVGSTTEYPSYPATDATDTGAGYLSTDFASFGGGVGTFLHLDLGQVYNVTRILYTDRTSSGAGNGSNAMGIYDYVTAYTFNFFSNSNFTGLLSSQSFSASPGCTSGNCVLANFQHNDILTPVSAQYVEFVVTAANGGNPGAADISLFTPTPEPGSTILMASGLGFMLLMARKHLVRS
jgi:hypothetical protein